MSVLLEFSMFPTDVGESKSKYVSKITKMIRESGVSYKLTPMSTIIETESVEEALEIVKLSYDTLKPYSNRIYSSIKIDIRDKKSNRMDGKIESIQKHIGEVSK